MSVRSDYPELGRISNGMGVHILEDAEDQARRALDELARLRAAADERGSGVQARAAIKWGSDRGIGITVIVWAPNPKPATCSTNPDQGEG